MRENIILFACVYALVISAISVITTVADKAAAKAKKRRVPERVLMLEAILGGAVPMLLTMKLIHHKTRHKKFMLGIPAIILIEMLCVFAVCYLKYIR